VAASSGPQSTSGPGGLDDFSLLLAPREIVDGEGGEPPRHGRDQRKRRRWPWVLAVVLLLVALVGGGGAAAYSTYPEQVKALFGWKNDYTGSGTAPIDVVVAQGDSGSDIAAVLERSGVTKTEAAFYDLLLKTKPEPSLEPGTYRLRKHMSAAAALKALEDPAARVVSSVAIPEGSTAAQILKITAKSTGVSLADLQAVAKDPGALGVPSSAPSIEGYLFPATYTFEPKTSPTKMLQTMVDRMFKALDEAGVPKADRERVLTLAGLVQKEGNGGDDAKVARVFLNRIANGMPLQSDATVSYGAGGTTVVPTKRQYKDDNRYNTYLHKGLPAGPISNPGDKAIAAALHPAKGSWLFFVTVDLSTGETVFSTTDAQHEKAADRFRAWLAKHPDYAK